MSSKHHELADFLIWSLADLLRGDYAYIGGFSIMAARGQLDVTTARVLAI